MKHLKTFENSNNYYSKISEDDFRSKCIISEGEFIPKLSFNDGLRTFDKKEIFRIKNTFDKKYKVLIYQIHGAENCILSISTPLSVSSHRTLYLIYKLKDEWYYVIQSRSSAQINPFGFNGLSNKYKYDYYECDQFDGLLKCISEIDKRFVVNRADGGSIVFEGIKLFESFNEDGYEKVENLLDPSPDDPWMKHTLTFLSRSKFNMIKDVLSENYQANFYEEMLPTELPDGSLSDEDESMCHYMRVSKDDETHLCTIYECEDEWYRVVYTKFGDRESHLYICDQIDGLKNLLRSKGMIKYGSREARRLLKKYELM